MTMRTSAAFGTVRHAASIVMRGPAATADSSTVTSQAWSACGSRSASSCERS